MLKSRLALAAAIALLVLAAALAMAQSWGFYDPQTGACGYYVNSSGHQVPRPCGTASGATALCADGRYSYSEHPYAPGTCSYHGGVAQHLR
jgi:Protein of unknown function (DUF3761)